MSGTRTVEPSGIAEAIREIAAETVLPVKTSPVSTPTSLANEARARWVASSQGSQEVAPTCQSASATWTASHAGRGGSPYDAVFSQPGVGSQSFCASTSCMQEACQLI